LVNLSLFDLSGRLVVTLVRQTLKPGWHGYVWDGTDASGRVLASGTYFTLLQVGGRKTSRKLVFVPQ
jgi:hypothetical protein